MAEDNKKPGQEKDDKNDKVDKQEHREWIREEFNESKREKKKIFGFAKKLARGFDLRKRAMFGGKFTHGTKGKPTHGPRGNQG